MIERSDISDVGSGELERLRQLLAAHSVGRLSPAHSHQARPEEAQELRLRALCQGRSTFDRAEAQNVGITCVRVVEV